MTTRRLDIPTEINQAVCDIAERRRMSSESLLVSLITKGVRRERLHWAGRFLLFVVGPIITAFLVAGILYILPSRFPFSGTPSSYVIFLALLHWIRVSAELFFPWPATFIAIAAIFFGSKSAFGNLLDLFALFRKVTLLGAEIELNERTTRKLQAAASDIASALREYKSRINREVYRRVPQHQLDRAIAQFVDEHAFKIFTRKEVGDKFRCTIHIPDPVQEGYLYQLIDYYPDGGGAFRAYSNRFGIIGKVWRSEKSQIVGTLLPGLPATATHDDQIAIITRDWGMTTQEAERTLKKPSYAAFILEHNGDKLGVLYMDSEKREAFTSFDKDKGKRVPMSVDELDRTLRAEANKLISERIGQLLNDLAGVNLQLDLQNTP